MSDPDQKPARASGQARVLLAASAMGVAVLTLYPLEPVGSWAIYLGALGRAITDPLDPIAPAHAIVAAWLAWLAVRGWGSARAAVLVGLGLVALECVQAGMADRHARAGDVVLQWLGIWIGVAIARRWPVQRFRGLPWRLVWLGLGAGAVALAVFAGVRGQTGHRLGPMDETFWLMVGDEFKGERPWLGDVHSLEIVATAEPDGEGERVRYDFDTSETADLGTLGIGLRRVGDALQSVEPAVALSRAIESAQGVRIEMEITPMAADQTGPARIVSLSKGIGLRNLTIGQEGDALVVRARTQRSGRNASKPQSVFPGVLAAGVRTRLTVWTDGGSARLWIDGVPAGIRQHQVSPRDWLGFQPAWGDLAASLVLFGPMGLAMGAMIRQRGPAWALGLLLPVGAVGVVWIAALSLDRPIAWWVIVMGVGCSALGLLTSRGLMPARCDGGDC